MSRKANCRDSAVAESFLSSLKKERIRKQIYKNRELAQADVADYIAWLESAFARGFMNHRYLSGRSPVFRKLGLNPAFRDLLGRIKARSEQFVP